MMRKLAFVMLGTAVALLLVLPAVAQSATMSAPIVRTGEGHVSFSVHIQNFASGHAYRIGFGAPAEATPKVTVELLKEDESVGVEPSDFSQGYTGQWWNVPKLAARGFVLTPDQLPPAGQDYVFRVTVPKEVADQFEKFYLFVSRDYGSNTWYLEDGAELDHSYW